MKKLSILLLSILSFSVSAQKIKAIGIDLGGNILPLFTKYQGFTGGLVIQITENDKRNVEIIMGYGSFERPNNGSISRGIFTQKSQGFYASVGKNFDKYWGWHGTVAIYDLTTTVVFNDSDFNTPYQFTFAKESLGGIGGDIYRQFPVKISKRFQTNLRANVSISLQIQTGNSEQILYAPGFNQLSPKIFLPTFGFGFSVPLLINLKTPSA